MLTSGLLNVDRQFILFAAIPHAISRQNATHGQDRDISINPANPVVARDGPGIGKLNSAMRGSSLAWPTRVRECRRCALSLLRAISRSASKGEAFADRAKSVAFDDAGLWHRLCDRLADMGEPHRTAGQEHRVDVVLRTGAPARGKF